MDGRLDGGGRGRRAFWMHSVWWVALAAAFAGCGSNAQGNPAGARSGPGAVGSGSSSSGSGAAVASSGGGSSGGSGAGVGSGGSQLPGGDDSGTLAGGQDSGATGTNQGTDAAAVGVGDGGAVSVQCANPTAPAPADDSKWANAGTFQTMVVSNSGPGGMYTLFVPMPLTQNGVSAPIMTWGDGVTTTPSDYTALLTSIASHGIFVVASNSTMTGTGKEMTAGWQWAVAQNTTMGSPYFGQLNTQRIACFGYSMGGIGSVICGHDPAITTTMVIAGGDQTINTLTNPILLIGNQNDELVNPASLLAPQYASVTKEPIVYGVSQGTEHLQTIGNGGVHRGYVTAWMAYFLRGEQDACRVFFGDDNCTMCKDPAWVVERKNVN